MKRILPLTIALAAVFHFTQAPGQAASKKDAQPAKEQIAETTVQKAKGTVIKKEIQFDEAAPKVVLDFISKESGIPVFYTPPKDAATETHITLQALPYPVTADDAFNDVALLGNLTLTYKKDGAHFEQKTGKADTEPAAGGNWVQVVAAKPFSSPDGIGMVVFIRYSAAKDGAAIFAVPFENGAEARDAVMPSQPLKAGTGGCVRGFFSPGDNGNPVDEVKAVMQGSADAESKFAVNFDGKDPVLPVKDLSTFQTPGQLWVYILKLRNRPNHSDEAAVAANDACIQLAGADFLKRWPKDPLRWDVKLGNDEAALQLAQQGKGGLDPAKTEADLQQIAAAPDAAQDTKDAAAFDIATIEVGKADDAKIEPLVAALHRDHPDAFGADTLTTLLGPRLEKYDDDKKAALLTPLAQSADPEIADQAGALLRFVTAKKKLEALKTAPLDLKFTALDGTPVDLAKLRGKVVLVDFWATWCGPCMHEVPNVVAAYKKYHDKGFEVIGISLDQKKEDVQRVTKEQGMEWPQYFDGKWWNNEISSSYGIEAIPAMWLVDKKGMVVNQNAGDGLEDNIEKLLAE